MVRYQWHYHTKFPNHQTPAFAALLAASHTAADAAELAAFTCTATSLLKRWERQQYFKFIAAKRTRVSESGWPPYKSALPDTTRQKIGVV